MSPAVALLALALAVQPSTDGLPAAAAVVFHEMDRALSSGDVEGLIDLFHEGYRSPSPVNSRDKIAGITRRTLARHASVSLETTIVAARRLGVHGIFAVSVDHRLALDDTWRVIPKTYLMRRDESGDYRISFAVDLDPEGPRMPGSRKLEVPLFGASLSAPRHWLSLPVRRGLLLHQEILLHHAMDEWISVGVLDPGARSMENLFEFEVRSMRRWMADGVTVEERGTRRVGDLEGPWMRLRLGNPGNDPGERTEITYLPHGGLVLRLAWNGPGTASPPELGSLLGLRMLPPAERTGDPADHRAGIATGERYRNKEAGIGFRVPEGWMLRVQAAPFAYLVQGLGPGGEILQVGAWATQEGLGRAGMPGPSSAPELTVGGRPAWRGPSNGPAATPSVFVGGEDGLVHFFTLEGSDRGEELLDRILATVVWSR